MNTQQSMYHASIHRSALLDYYISLGKLARGDKAVSEYLDTPLDKAIVRARFASGWAATYILASGLSTWRHSHVMPFPEFAPSFRIVTLCLSLLALWCLAGLVMYGFLRLFTLLSHNLTTNLFKIRGQRLRLLNVYTTLLSLCPPIVVSLQLARVNHTLSIGLVTLFVTYGVVLLSRAYNIIFHQSRLHGFRLVICGWAVTCFVLGICALAIAVAFAVVILVVLAILRPILHHG